MNSRACAGDFLVFLKVKNLFRKKLRIPPAT